MTVASLAEKLSSGAARCLCEILWKYQFLWNEMAFGRSNNQFNKFLTGGFWISSCHEFHSKEFGYFGWETCREKTFLRTFYFRLSRLIAGTNLVFELSNINCSKKKSYNSSLKNTHRSKNGNFIMSISTVFFKSSNVSLSISFNLIIRRPLNAQKEQNLLKYAQKQFLIPTNNQKRHPWDFKNSFLQLKREEIQIFGKNAYFRKV